MRLRVRGLAKRFGATVALDAVDLEVAAGEVHALVGENGAGKSTLLGVLGGAIAADGGAITLDGVAYAPASPLEARRAGVAVVHQELSLCPHMTVAENVVLGDEPARAGFVDAARGEAIAARALGELGARIDPRARVADLAPAARQLVEIARALARPDARVVLLDEPTSSLGSDDAARLLEVVRSLAARGLAVVYISHVLEEVLAVARRVTVLRDGRTVASASVDEVTADDLVTHMAGRRVEQLFPRSARTAGEVVLELDGLAGARKPERASLSLRRGEVLGIAGLVGAGRTELVRAVFGLDPVRRGAVRVGAHVGPASPARRWAQGVGMLSEDRKGEGIALAMSVADNVTLTKLAPLGPLGLVLGSRQDAAARTWIERLAIRCGGPGAPAGSLSGGNQQKVALARLFHHDVDVLLLDEPTRGIDVASKAFLYGLVDELARAGKAVLFVSSWLPELLGVCDRIAVMRRGVLGEARPADTLDEKAILVEATGA